MTGSVAPLVGFTVAVTASRRREELGSLLERRGARVVYAPALRIMPVTDDAQLLEATRSCVERPPDVTVATTGIGFRAWMEAADGWGLGDRLAERLATTTLLARGPKARGAIRAAGLVDHWSAPSESSAEVLAHLLDGDLAGRRVAVQLHGEPLEDFIAALRAGGADVVPVPVYRWTLPDDVTPLRRLVDAVVAGQVDCVTFTSAAAVTSLLRLAADAGLSEPLLEAFTGAVTAACVGPVTAAGLERLGVRTVQPTRSRLGALVRAIVQDVPARRPVLRVAGHAVQVRGHVVLVDGQPRELAPTPMAVLNRLARTPGEVVSRAELLAVLAAATDEHAVEMAVTRLRGALGAPLVRTVVKRGYRLACDATRPAETADSGR